MPPTRTSELAVVNDNVLDIHDLQVHFYTEEGEVRAVDGVSLEMKRGRIMGLVGESGCHRAGENRPPGGGLKPAIPLVWCESH